jgi:Fe-S cluster assembly protein SufD
MSVATPQSAAEEKAVASAQHGATAHSDGGWDARESGYVPVQTRSDRFKSNVPAEHPEVNGREAEWKLTPVALVRDLIDGTLDGSPYPFLAAQNEGADAEWIDRTDARIGRAGQAEEKSSANAWNAFEKAMAITVTGEEPSEITVSRSLLGGEARGAHTVITGTKHSRGRVILLNTGQAKLVENVEIVVEDGAHLTVVSVQEWADDAVHLATHFVTVGRDATFRHVVVSLGGKVVRVNPSVALSGDGADGELYGLYFADAGQHLEQRVYLHHEGANTRGRVNYKGALQGEGAHTVWVGDVLIGPDAAGTDSYEQNRNLVLSEGTRADSIPNLEIETGEILGAGHASATGRFDDEQLFYLQARGITEHEARRLVVLGFLTEIIQKIGKPELEQRLQVSIDDELNRSSGGAL